MRIGRLAAAWALASAMACLAPAGNASGLSGREFDCLIEPSEVLRIGSPVQGVLESVPVDRGDRVEKGQVIARLESDIEQATVKIAELRASNDVAIRSAKARAGYQRKQEQRTGDLYRQKTASQEHFDKVTTERALAELGEEEAVLEQRLAQLELQRARAALERRTIRSPIKGVITERVLYAGEYMNEQSHVVTVAQVDPLHVEVFVPLEFHGLVRKGISAEIFPMTPAGGSYVARASVVDAVIDAASGTFGVRVELPNEDGAVPAGVKCRVRFNPD